MAKRTSPRRNATRRPVGHPPAPAPPGGSSGSSGAVQPALDADDAAPDQLALDAVEELLAELRTARSPLDAELTVVGAVTDLALGVEEALDTEGVPDDEVDSLVEDALMTVISPFVAAAERIGSGDALGLLRALSTIAGAASGDIDAAAARVAAAGVDNPRWADGIGAPAFVRAWRYHDELGFQDSVSVVFAYRHREHCLNVLIDHNLGGGVKDIWLAVGNDAHRMRGRYVEGQSGQDLTELDDIDVVEAHARLSEAMLREACPEEDDQFDDVQDFLPLLGSRVAWLGDLARGGSEGSLAQRQDVGVKELRTRLLLVRANAPHILLCAFGAGVALLIAEVVLGHSQPIFAPIAAVLGLGVSYGKRLRRVVEVVSGVAVGVVVGDLLVRAFGSGVWQVALVVAVGMTIAITLRAGTLMINQSAVQGVFVTLIHPPTTGAIVDRWLDAVVGGAVALLLATLVPKRQLRRPLVLAQGLLATVADLLLEASSAARDGDADRAHDALAHARGTQGRLDQLRTAASDGIDSARLAPFRRHHAAQARTVSAMAVPLDRAVRNVRVLSRRLSVATDRLEVLPEELLELVDALAGAALRLGEDLGAGQSLDDAVDALAAVGLASSLVPRSSLSGDVVLAQVRSTAVDLLMVAGLDDADAHGKVPARPGERFG